MPKKNPKAPTGCPAPLPTEFTVYFKHGATGITTRYVTTIMAVDAAQATNSMLRSGPDGTRFSPTVRSSGAESTTFSGDFNELTLSGLHKGVSMRDLLPPEVKNKTVIQAAEYLHAVEAEYRDGLIIDLEELSAPLRALLTKTPEDLELAHGIEREETKAEAHTTGATAEPQKKPRAAEDEPLGSTGAAEVRDDDEGVGDARQPDMGAADGDAGDTAEDVLGDAGAGDRSFRIKVGLNVRIWGDVTVEAPTLDDAVDYLTNNPSYVSDNLVSEVRIHSDDIDVYNFTHLSLLHATDEGDATNEVFDLEIDVPDEDEVPNTQTLRKIEDQEPDISYLTEVPDFVPIDTYLFKLHGQTVEVEAPAGMSGTDLLLMENVADYIRHKASLEPTEIEYVE